MARTVSMHVGVAKTGTTYLQRILWSNRDLLRGAGVLYPGKKSGDQFVASIDLRDLQAEKYSHLSVTGMWDRVAAEVRAFDGNAVISHETFARCSSADVRRVQASLGDAHLRVVLTVRDLARQIPAVWQETLKNRATSSYEQFLTDVFVETSSGEHKFFWRPQDVARVVRRWGRAVGMDNVYVVTVPPTGAPRDELWNRFAAAVELPAVDIEMPAVPGNVSLGPAEAELLRHVNASLPEDFPWPRYLRAVKRQFAEQKLAQRQSTKLAVPPPWRDAVAGRAAAMVEQLSATGCQVIGDLADLEPDLATAGVSGPDELSRDELLQVAAQVIRDEVILRPKRPRRRRPLPAGPADTFGDRIRAVAGRARQRISARGT